MSATFMAAHYSEESNRSPNQGHWFRNPTSHVLECPWAKPRYWENHWFSSFLWWLIPSCWWMVGKESVTNGGVSTIWAGREGKVVPDIKDVRWGDRKWPLVTLRWCLFNDSCLFCSHQIVVTDLFPLLCSTVVEAVSAWLMDAALGSWCPVPSVLQSRSMMKRKNLTDTLITCTWGTCSCCCGFPSSACQ